MVAFVAPVATINGEVLLARKNNKNNESLKEACHVIGCALKEFFERAHIWKYRWSDAQAINKAVNDFIRKGKIQEFARAFLDAVLSGRYRPAT
ncbi:MAG: hypothetical protein JWN90_610 [Parcubacteria group bacterium]|nr:hypothetical protein [Parcubacteria group bacterium]